MPMQMPMQKVNYSKKATMFLMVLLSAMPKRFLLCILLPRKHLKQMLRMKLIHYLWSLLAAN